ncbi:MAG TPA: hypothetical protein VH684_04925 [Xanthobacteraceae bacterium]|jgi:hypothetical protein
MQTCRPGQIIGYCNIGLAPIGKSSDRHPFSTEKRDLQAGFVLTQAGRVCHASHSSQGGFLDQLADNRLWEPGGVIGELECDESWPQQNLPPLRTMLVAGRRVTEYAEDRAGLLTGWHDRKRAWWADGHGIAGTLLTLVSCDLGSAVRGRDHDFSEILGMAAGQVQVVLIPDDVLVSCARTVLERIRRSPQQNAEIASDLAATFPLASASAADWNFCAVLLAALQSSPLGEPSYVLTYGGLQRVGAPDAVLMSLISEPPRVFRHRRLGYTICLHDYRLRELNEAARTWIRSQFETVIRGPAEINRDYRELISEVNTKSNTVFVVQNLNSSSINETILNYSQIDGPLGNVVWTIRAKEMNLMLQDLAAECKVAVLDHDAMVAELGAARHLPDGVHPSGTLEAEMRREIIAILAARGVPGFAKAAII